MISPQLMPFWRATMLLAVAGSTGWAMGQISEKSLVESAAEPASAQQSSAAGMTSENPPEIAQPEQVEPPRDGVLQMGRAWEYSHYRVRVWICTDGSADVDAATQLLDEKLVNLAVVCDPSGWELLPEMAPADVRWKLLQSLANAENELVDLDKNPALKHDDKLTVVALKSASDGILVTVRELDLRTNLWGAVSHGSINQHEVAGEAVFDLIRNAFMPVAMIEKVNQQNETWLTGRGVNLCKILKYDFQKNEYVLTVNERSPVFVKGSDVMVPVLRRVDKKDPTKVSQEIVQSTFIKVDPAGPPAGTDGSGNELALDQAAIFGHVHSSFNAPLVQKKNKRLEKLALVIRPPTQGSFLQVFSAADSSPMEGIEVISRPLGAKGEEGFELLGKTDWRGMMEIPVSEEGLRMILLRRGDRPLMKIPIMPGFRPVVSAKVVNDDARLFAAGVVRGMGNEILDVVSQRKIYEQMIIELLETPDERSRQRADRFFERYSNLPGYQDLKMRLADERAKLKAQAKDKSEDNYINDMFDTLDRVMSSYLSKSEESALRKRLQETSEAMTKSPDSSEQP